MSGCYTIFWCGDVEFNKHQETEIKKIYKDIKHILLLHLNKYHEFSDFEIGSIEPIDLLRIKIFFSSFKIPHSIKNGVFHTDATLLSYQAYINNLDNNIDIEYGFPY